jgi:ribokinase
VFDLMKLLVLGNVTVDDAMDSPVWPTPGHTVVVGAPRRDLGGKGANQALVAKRAGADVRLIAAIGDDDLAAWSVDTLGAEGFDPPDLIRLPRPTDRSLIFVGPGGENAIASITGCSAAVTDSHAHAGMADLAPGDGLLLQGNLSFGTTEAALREARRRSLVAIFNPSPLQPQFGALLRLVDLLVVNEGEAAALGGDAGKPDDLMRRLQEAGAGTVVLTLGARGARASGRLGTAQVAAEPVRVVDTTGAGDTFMGVLMATLFTRGLALQAAMRAASRAAALTVSRPGTWSAFPTRAEIAAILAAL